MRRVTRTFSTAIKPPAEFGFTNNGKVITKIMVRDASGAAVLPASVFKIKAEGTASGSVSTAPTPVSILRVGA